MFGFDFTCRISLHSLGWSSVSSVGHWSDLHDSWVDGATDTVLHLQVELWDDVEFEGSIFLQIFLWWLIDDISDGESFDSLVLGTVSSAVDADDGSDVASVGFVTTVISSLLWHFDFVVLIK